MAPNEKGMIMMACAEKFGAGAVRNILRHNRREIEHSSNHDIDPKRLERDYILSPDRGMTEYDYFLQRKSELYCYNRNDVKVMVGWIVTAPQDLDPERYDNFFYATYNFLANRYGEENVVQAIPYDVFASINAVTDDTERQERLEQLAYLLLPDKANDSEAGIFFCKNGRKMITAALICYYGMGWGFVQICEFFLGHDWRGLLNDIAKQQNQTANMFISSFAGASEQNTAGCKQAADDALKLFATNEKIKNALRKSASYEQSISPATLETNSVYIYIPDEKLKIYGDLLRIITAQSMEYFSSRPPEHKKMILFCLDEFASFGKLQITEALRKLRKRHIRIMVLTQSLADLDMIYGKDERKAMLGNFKFTVILGCKDTETQEYFSKMIGEKHSLLAIDPNQKPQLIIKPAVLAHLEQDLFVICDDGAIRLRKNFYFK